MLVEFSLASTLDNSKSKHREVYELEDNLYRPMLAGPWEGDDARDVLQEAINWWEKELDLIDRAANN